MKSLVTTPLLFSLMLLLFSPFSMALDEVAIQLKWKHSFQFAGYYAAKAQGYYQDAGLAVDIVPATPGQDVIAPVLQGQAEFGVSSNSLLQTRDAGKPVVMIASIFQHSPVVLLSLEKDITKGIHSIQNSLAMLETSAVEVLAFLKKANIDINKMSLQQHSFNPQDLIEGNVDVISAYCINEPYFLEKENLFYQSYKPNSLNIDFYGDNLYTTQTQIDQHPERVKAFREASLKGWEYAMANKEEIIQLILKEYTQDNSYDFLRFQANAMENIIQPVLVELGYSSQARWQHIVEIYQELDLLKPDFRLDGFLYDPSPSVDLAFFYQSLIIGVGILCLFAGGLVYVIKMNRQLDFALLESQEAKHMIWQQANLDPLTNLHNRRNFKGKLQQAMEKALANKTKLALVYLDLDDFKAINDFHGHDMGDRLLVEVTRRLLKVVDKTHTLYRLGGDEFTIIIEDYENKESLKALAKAILTTLDSPFYLGKEKLYISVSIGVSQSPKHANTGDALLRYADEAMYSAKTHGRNQYQFFTQKLHQDVLYRMQIISDLRSAIEEEEFELHYQPIVTLNTGSIKKLEALIRWNHPVHGLTMPLEFIKIAEETSHIIEIGDWVFKTACSQLKDWQDKLNINIDISINTSPAQYQYKTSNMDAWFDYLSSLKLDPRKVIIEITESMIMKENSHIEKKLIEFGQQ